MYTRYTLHELRVFIGQRPRDRKAITHHTLQNSSKNALLVGSLPPPPPPPRLLTSETARADLTADTRPLSVAAVFCLLLTAYLTTIPGTIAHGRQNLQSPRAAVSAARGMARPPTSETWYPTMITRGQAEWRSQGCTLDLKVEAAVGATALRAAFFFPARNFRTGHHDRGGWGWGGVLP